MLYITPLFQEYQHYLDLIYNKVVLVKYGVEDELSAIEEPYDESFTQLVDITRIIRADDEQVYSIADCFV